MTHAERALAHIKKTYPDDNLAIEDIEAIIIILDAIEQTQEPEPRKAPQPLTKEELTGLALYETAGLVSMLSKQYGLGIYRTADVDGCCK